MFNHSNHLIDTTIPKDAIKVIYINQHEDFISLNPFTDSAPSFLCSNLSNYFGSQGFILEKRLGIGYQIKAKRELESAFCVVLFSDDATHIHLILQQIKSLLDESSGKKPLIILVNTHELLLKNIIPSNLINEHVICDALYEISNTSIQKEVFLQQLKAVISILYTRVSIDANPFFLGQKIKG